MADHEACEHVRHNQARIIRYERKRNALMILWLIELLENNTITSVDQDKLIEEEKQRQLGIKRDFGCTHH